MHVEILGEAGYNPAMTGLSLSYNQPVEKMQDVSLKIYNKDGGHNKFLESIMIWLLVDAPRYWWQQADTYRISTKQSESTMHTIMKGELDAHDFENNGVTKSSLADLNRLIKKKDFETLKKRLPESFMQRRVWMMSYKTLRNIVQQRSSHKLGNWKEFIKQVANLVQHPYFIDKKDRPRTCSSEETGRFGIGSRFNIGAWTWTVHRFLDGGKVLLINDVGPYNMILSEEDVIQTRLF